MKPLRILHVVGGLANASGTTHIILDLSSELAELGCDVQVFFVEGRTPDTVTPADARVHVTGFPLTASVRWAWSRELGRTLRATASGFDVIHTHSLWQYPHLATHRACRHAGTPYIVSPQGALDPWSLQQGSWHKQLYAASIEKRILNGAACLHAVSEFERHTIRSQGIGVPVAVVPNGVRQPPDGERPGREEARKELGLSHDAGTVLFLGRLHPKKGVDLLLDSFGEVHRDVPSTRLLVAGTDGGSGYRSELERRAGPGTRFLGELKDEKKRAAFAAADLFVLMSHAEGMPIAVLEALSMGCPVLITEACHLPEVEEAGAGIVIPRDKETLQQSLRTLLGEPETLQRMREPAHHLVQRCFSWPAVAQRMHTLYQAVAEGNNGEEVLG